MTDISKEILQQLNYMTETLERLAPAVPKFHFQEGIFSYIWNNDAQSLLPVHDINAIPYPLLKGIEDQKKTLLTNSRQFALGLPANNALLWGAKGMGKSSLVKTVFTVLSEEQKTVETDIKLFLIEILREDLKDLPMILLHLRDLPHRFILYCDDLSFTASETEYKSLKAILEGGIQSRPQNVIFYATSNHKHLLPRPPTETDDLDKLALKEEMDDKISLSDRFGIWLGFHNCTEAQWEDIISSYARAFKIEMSNYDVLYQAKEWSKTRGAKSGRVAWQFITDLRGKQALKGKPVVKTADTSLD